MGFTAPPADGRSHFLTGSGSKDRIVRQRPTFPAHPGFRAWIGCLPAMVMVTYLVATILLMLADGNFGPADVFYPSATGSWASSADRQGVAQRIVAVVAGDSCAL